MSYKTVKEKASDILIEKKSKFIATALPVKTVDEAEEFVREMSKKYFDATHNVYAYLLRSGQSRYSDNGEPQGTAGIPILDMLKKEEIFDVCVVVTRYFGGTLLGTGGLVRAYSHSAKLAIEAAKVITMEPCVEIELNFDYAFYGKLSYILPNYTQKTISDDFADSITLKILMLKSELLRFEKEITELSNGKVIPKVMNEYDYSFQ